MIKHTLTPSCLLAAATLLPAIEAGEPIPRPNRLTFGPRVGFNVHAGFSSSLTSPTASPGPATGGGLDRVYDDGYVRVDSSGNADGKTWFWGYDNAAQVNPAADSLTLNALSGGDPATVDDLESDVFVGGELTYTRYFFEWGRANWGLELGGAFMPVEVKDNSTLTGLITTLNDSFSLGGITPPAAPYFGSFEGPGAVISDSPTRVSANQSATFSGDRKIETTAVGLRLGPSLDIPMGKPLWLQISGGLHLLYADTKFTYHETVTLEGGGAGPAQSGSVSDQDWIFGAYVRGQVLWTLSPALGIFANAEYLMTDEIEIGTASHRATLDFGESFGCAAGLAWTF